jgi:hypothetical protein
VFNAECCHAERVGAGWRTKERKDENWGMKKVNYTYSRQVMFLDRVPDPNPDTEPPDPRVFWPTGSESFYHYAKMIIKILNSTIL